MTKPLPFTKASITRRILGAKAAGLYTIGIKPDGTLIVADKPDRYGFPCSSGSANIPAASTE